MPDASPECCVSDIECSECAITWKTRGYHVNAVKSNSFFAFASFDSISSRSERECDMNRKYEDVMAGIAGEKVASFSSLHHFNTLKEGSVGRDVW